ncbi:MAG: TIGR00153 family protein [Deltaproteobacteria bacterium]|nr:TIGR00153 family protein [Deltaproteobacteria bacterium]MBW2072585.1 TIGR00153 family protein [Deltaproteobacteria bacterium]
MRFSFFSLFYVSPFEKLKEHADKVRECAWMFKRAAECYVSQDCEEFDQLTEEVARLESQADFIKRNLRNHIPKGLLMPVDKFMLFDYLREQDHVLDDVEEALYWLSFRPMAGIPEELIGDFLELIDAVIPAIEKLPEMVEQSISYFRNKTEEQRNKLKSIIRDIRQSENEADVLEHELKKRAFAVLDDPVTIFHVVRLLEIIGSIADDAQNASDRMRAMIAR